MSVRSTRSHDRSVASRLDASTLRAVCTAITGTIRRPSATPSAAAGASRVISPLRPTAAAASMAHRPTRVRRPTGRVSNRPWPRISRSGPSSSATSRESRTSSSNRPEGTEKSPLNSTLNWAPMASRVTVTGAETSGIQTDWLSSERPVRKSQPRRKQLLATMEFIEVGEALEVVGTENPVEGVLLGQIPLPTSDCSPTGRRRVLRAEGEVAGARLQKPGGGPQDDQVPGGRLPIKLAVTSDGGQLGHVTHDRAGISAHWSELIARRDVWLPRGTSDRSNVCDSGRRSERPHRVWSWRTHVTPNRSPCG